MKSLMIGSMLLLAGCVAESGTLVDWGDGEDCEPIDSGFCDDVHCGDPVVELGVGRTGFGSIEDDVMPITFGTGNGGGCGYHLDLAVRTEQLCPVLFVDYTVDLLGVGGGPLYEGSNHVQFVRDSEPAEPGSTVQTIWNLRAHIPREHYPNDPTHFEVCPDDAGSDGPCDEFEFLIRLQVQDHSGRMAMTERVLDPECCN